MKQHLKRQLRRLAADRPYQVVAASAATLVVASGVGVLATVGDTPDRARVRPAAVAEQAPHAGELPARAELSAPQTSAPSLTTPAPTATSPSATKSRAASPSAAASSAAPDPDLTRSAAPKAPASKVLDHEYQAQITYYYCGPAAVRNALTAMGISRSQDDLAGRLGTTQFGTNSAADTTRVLNQLVKGEPYRTRMISGGAATAAQTERLRADVVAAVADDRSPVVNVAGSTTDLSGGWHSFPGGHYVAVVGYRDGGKSVKIADSANPATASYWLTVDALADWIATRGYSA
ncbi:C39 family peptidase [Micromonospora fluostatini]|uniref:C39 family peptidase n=1 Tax=Micromonospora sp. JCM 30529 TaxID=3421643 RepID=UPI003D16E87F